MLLTVKDVSLQLQIKPSTIYAWAKQGKIPCKWLHKLLRSEPDQIQAWLAACPGAPQARPLFTVLKKHTDIDALIEAAKREVYTPAHGETRPKSGLIRKGEQVGLFKRNKTWWMSITHNGRQIRKTTGSTDKRLAEAILAKVTMKLIEGRYFDRLEENERTFREMVERYITERVVGASRHGERRARCMLKHLLQPSVS